MRKQGAHYLKALALCAAFTVSVSFCAKSLSNRLKPHFVSGYIIYIKKDENGEIKQCIKKSDGIVGVLANVSEFALGANFLPGEISRAISGNIEYDVEKVTIIDDETQTDKNGENTKTAENSDKTAGDKKSGQVPSASILEKNINSAGGKTKINDRISINNETSYTIDGESLKTSAPAFSIKSQPQVLIYHTHTTESYQPDADHDFSHTTPDRTTDNNYNVAAVGDKLAAELKACGIGVIHLTNLYDYPKYNDSYARSCVDAKEVIEKNPSIKVVIDLHRDAIVTKEGQKTKITADINGEKVAQVMLVVGTDELGLKHDNWRTNLKFAADVQKELLKISSNFARPINVRTSRFNGHIAPAAVIIEVGASGNTLDEALNSVPHIASAISAVVNNYTKAN